MPYAVRGTSTDIASAPDSAKSTSHTIAGPRCRHSPPISAQILQPSETTGPRQEVHGGATPSRVDGAAYRGAPFSDEHVDVVPSAALPSGQRETPALGGMVDHRDDLPGERLCVTPWHDDR